MAHEMGHYVLGHVVRSRSCCRRSVILVGLYWSTASGARLIGRFRDRFGFDRLSDVASVPLLLLLMQLTSLVADAPWPRLQPPQEHEADRFALELTRTNHSGALAFRKLMLENLSNPRPTRSCGPGGPPTPSIGERIDFCNRYHPWAHGQPLKYGTCFVHDPVWDEAESPGPPATTHPSRRTRRADIRRILTIFGRPAHNTYRSVETRSEERGGMATETPVKGEKGVVAREIARVAARLFAATGYDATSVRRSSRRRG